MALIPSVLLDVGPGMVLCMLGSHYFAGRFSSIEASIIMTVKIMRTFTRILLMFSLLRLPFEVNLLLCSSYEANFELFASPYASFLEFMSLVVREQLYSSSRLLEDIIPQASKGWVSRSGVKRVEDEVEIEGANAFLRYLPSLCIRKNLGWPATICQSTCPNSGMYALSDLDILIRDISAFAFTLHWMSLAGKQEAMIDNIVNGCDVGSRARCRLLLV